MAIATFIVEDNAVVLRGLVEALEEIGDVRVVGTASSVDDAVHWLHAHTRDWNLLIIDLFLIGGGSGLEVVTACQERERNQRALVLTNYATPEVRRRSLALGADAVFDKSTEIDELMSYCARLSNG